MKNEQRQQAQSLYTQSGLTKTQIAELLTVSRRTIYQWSIEDNWEKLRMSARHLPAILAEKCYYLVGHFTDHLLSKESAEMSITKVEADILHKLVSTIGKLKKGSTVNENMETFTYFLERIKRRDSVLAEMVAPHVAEYIEARSKVSESDFMLDGFDKDGYLPHPAEEINEHKKDKEDWDAVYREYDDLSVKEPAEPYGNKQNDTPPAAAPQTNTVHGTKQQSAPLPRKSLFGHLNNKKTTAAANPRSPLTTSAPLHKTAHAA